MNWQRWIRPGLVITILVAVVAVFARSGSIGRDLASEVSARLAAEGQVWATVDGSARDVTIRGTAPSPEAQQTVVRLAEGVRGVHSVTDRSGLLPIASPYAWGAQKTGRRVSLSGSVPSEGVRTSLLAAARRALPRAEILDQTTLARGAPDSFSATLAFAMSRLADLAEGSVTLTDSTLVVSGVAADAEAYADARKALREDLPPSIALGPVDILPARADPYVWSANFDGSAVTISGFVPNEIVHETLVTTVKATLPGVPIEDRVQIASGEPPGFAEAAGFAIAELDRLRRGGVTLDGLKLDLAGEAKSVDDYEAMRASLAGTLPEGVQVVAAAIEPAVASPYGWRGERSEGRVVLTGYVPNPESRAEITTLAQALFPGDVIDQRVRIAAGEPKMDWLGAIKFALGQLAGLREGSVELGDKTYAVEGEARDSEAFAAISEINAKTLPASLALKQANVVPPPAKPYRFLAERRGTGVAIAGNIASEADRQRILTAAHSAFGAGPLEDRLTYASGAPDGFVAAATKALQVLSRLAGGRAEIVDQALTLSGYTYYPSAVTEIGESLGSDLPGGFAVASNTIAARQDDQPVAADHCRDLLQTALHIGAIGFDGGKAELAGNSQGVLDRVSGIIARCPSADIEIGAHSDADGSASRNRDLTQTRAEAIVEYLVNAGVKRERLTAVGYGETKPIADNATAEGKAANRRIEFTVTEPAGG